MAMPFVLSLPLTIVIGLAAGDESVLVYLGSGGCDGDDHKCIEGDTSKEHVVRAIELRHSGELLARPDIDGVNTGDMPVWLAVHETTSRHCLYVALANANQTLALSVDPQTGAAKKVGSMASGGATPVYLEVHGADVLLVANYNAPDDSKDSTGAAASSLRIGDDCSLTPGDSKPHAGHSVNPVRQGAAHVHSFVPAPYGEHKRAAYACDLGLDAIFSYDVGPDGALGLERQIPVYAGSGPRHIAPHPSAPFLYVVSEMDMTVTVLKQVQCVDGGHCLDRVQVLSLVPDGQSGKGSKAAEIAILPDGSAVYATNRGELNTVTVFEVLGNYSLAQRQLVEVAPYPRGMTLAFNGSLLLVAGQRDSSITSYRVGKGGMLTATGHRLSEGVPPHPATFAVLPEREAALTPMDFTV